MRLDNVRMVRPMISRKCAAGFVVILCLASMLAPKETFGRGGGFGGRAFSAHSGFHPPALRAPMQAPIHMSRPIERLPLHRRQFGLGFPLAFPLGYGVPLTVPDGPFAYDSEYGVPSYTDSAGDGSSVTGSVRVRVNPAFFYRPGCNSETVVVPSEDGGERSINIVRC
jgi:hypothetical protein